VTALPDGGRICSSTGLVLVPAEAETTWRVSKSSYGALNPLVRPIDADEDPESWGRFDTHGGRTIYCASSRECAFAEVLAYHRRKLGESDSLAKDAAFLGLSPVELAALVDDEWQDRGHMRPGHLAKGWRTERSVYRVVLPASGWWALLEQPESMAALERHLGDSLASVGASQLDVSVLRGNNRDATILIADWVRAQTLDDGDRAHGIVYESRLATGKARAFWLRRVDDGAPLSSEPVNAQYDGHIAANDPDLSLVAERMGIKIW
jgi:RES domain-containing protein